MQTPKETIVVTWHDAPPERYWQRVSDTEYRSPAHQCSCILWRGRWVEFADEVLRQVSLNEIDTKLRTGEVGLVWERA